MKRNIKFKGIERQIKRLNETCESLCSMYTTFEYGDDPEDPEMSKLIRKLLDYIKQKSYKIVDVTIEDGIICHGGFSNPIALEDLDEFAEKFGFLSGKHLRESIEYQNRNHKEKKIPWLRGSE